MGTKNNMPRNNPKHQCSTKRKRNLFNKCADFFLGRAVDSTLIFPISAITSQSANPTKETMKQTRQLLDYITTQ